MEVIISIVGSLAAKAAEYVVDPTARQLSYLFKHKTKFLNLRTKVRDLEDARQRLQQSAEAATRNGEVLFDDVQRWLIEVNEKISEEAATQLQEDEVKATRRCFAGFCPDFKSRYHLSKKADREANAIAQLLTEKDAFKEVSYLPAIEVIDIIRPVKEYEAFGSRSCAFNEVMEALEDDTVRIIGVYGMGGVGKTTLVKEVAAQAKEKLSFDEVVFVAVTQTPNMMSIQMNIAEKVGMEFREEDMDARAARLRERLKKEKRVLVVLDDIWVSLDLRALGIPSADEHKGCKILMTSRRLDVLKRMDCHPNISIETLKEDETWNLFKKIAGQVVERPELQSTAVEVAKRCAGLPIAIATIAKALKPKENLFEWRDALRQLSNPSERNFKDIPADAYSAIELSYKFLEGDELGPIFLLCSIMGHNAAVEDLLRYTIGLGFIHDVNTMEEARNRVLTLLSNLKASCLLLEGSQPNRFDMHDVVRDVSQSIASRDLQWLALFEEWPDEEKMKESQLINLQNAKVSELLKNELECPNLTCFSIAMKDDSSLIISNNFFNGMQILKVLQFDDTKFTSLPSSIGSLKTLCTLRLRDCGLKDISILGELEKLEILDLHGSRMEILPKDIGQLTKLKLLDLSYCCKLKVISPNVLSKLSRLEELYLYHSFDKWEVEGTENPRSNASLVELQHLSRLTTLEVHIPHVEAIPKDNLFFGKLERYKISIGYEKWGWYHDNGMETSRMLKLQMNKSIHLVDGIKRLLGKTHSLHLDGFEDVEEMLYHPDVESFGQLRFIKVENCNILKILFSSSTWLFDKKVSCPALEVLEVKECHKLKHVFTSSMVKSFVHLKKLEVSECEGMEEVIEGTLAAEEGISSSIKVFSKLDSLILGDLPKLRRFCCGINQIEFPSLKSLRINRCPNLNTFVFDDGKSRVASPHYLFNERVSCPALEELEVKDCHKLKYIFTSSTVLSFVHLKTIEVYKCDEMEGVIEGTLAEGINSSIRVFPKLDSLTLRRLPQLKRFCCGMNPIEFPSLRSLEIRRCTNLNTFVFDDEKSPRYLFNDKVMLPVLEQLKIGLMKNLERLWPDLLVEHSFSRLTSIDLRGCHKLLNVFPLSMLTRLQRLDKLIIINCASVEELIFGSESGGSSSASEFPALTYLDLSDLPNLRSVHHNKMHSINWPSLKKMRVSRCDKVETLFASGETSSEQPLFWVNESTFPDLHQLTLGWNINAGMKQMIWHCQGQQQHQLPSPYFPNLKVVLLGGYKQQVTVFPSYLLQLSSLSNFQTLVINHWSFKEMIFRSEEGGEEKPASLLLSQITELKLLYLPKLMHLWKEKEGFPNLRFLQVHHCPELKANLVPSSVSFRNLVTLEVWYCFGIIKLITHSTAKSLVQLKEMSIKGCKNLQEIIQGEDDNDEISFPHLNHLELGELPKLESFCSSEKYTFGFPSLEFLVVYNCRNMKIFSQGHSNTPMLHKVLDQWAYRKMKMKMFSQGDSNTPMLHKVGLDRQGYEVRCKGGLNNTIQQLFREKYGTIEECENFKEDQSKPSTSNTQNITEKEDSSSTYNSA